MVNAKNIILGLGIIIIFGLLLWQGLRAFYPEPEREEFCGSGGISTNDECYENYQDARDVHSRNIFIISLTAGIICLIIAYTILSMEPIGSALIGCSIWAIFWGSFYNWRNFNEPLRFALLLLAFIIIIWFAFRLNKKSNNEINKG